jgi:P-type Ca2+ transporter type 2C
VGDVVQLNAGDKVPADGVIIEGSDVSCDESALTGESDTRPKDRYGEGDPFLLSGSTLASGYCTMLICAVGVNSRYLCPLVSSLMLSSFSCVDGVRSNPN